MAKKSYDWKRKAKMKDAMVGYASALDLDLFPCLGDIINGYKEDDKFIKGGSILMFVGNDGKFTACVSPAGTPNQFWCGIDDAGRILESIEKALQDDKGTWREKKKAK